MKPDHFRDIIATNALYRPGPLEGGLGRRLHRSEARPPAGRTIRIPVMKEVLEETHGVMVFQEQVMRILNLLGGIALADAYSCIKAISKKKLEMIAKFREAFIEGAREKGLEKKKAEDLFSQIEKFAGYGFNKSHSTAYALIAYQTAYLKAHYPVEFMAALLSGDIPGRNFKSKDPLVEHLGRLQADGSRRSCRRTSIGRTSISRSSAAEILFGLSAIKGCGSGAAEAICRGAASGRSVHEPVQLLRARRSASLRPGGDRNADQGRRVRFARRKAGPVDGGDRSGDAKRRGGAGRSQEWPARFVRWRRR